MKKILAVLTVMVSLCAIMAILCSCNAVDQANCAHEFGVWYTVVAPTCEENGEEISKCSICGKQTSRVASKLNHDWQVDSDTTNCVTSGEIVYVCRNDRNHVRREQKGPLGHQWEGGEVIEAATCEKTGKITQSVCAKCGAVSQTEIITPALGHDYIEQTRSDATCTENGNIHYVCSRDRNHTKDETIQAPGHDWETSVVTRPATCTAPGEAISGRCRRCHITQGTVEIPALGHDMQLQSTELLPNSEPDQSVCGGAGIETWECTRCGETETRNVTGTNHTFLGGWFFKENATCQHEGKKYRRCSVCNYEEYATIPKLAHDFTRVVYTQKPTCEKAGKMKIQCSMCSTYLSDTDEIAPATGHDWKELGISVFPTCEAQGRGEHICLTCGKKEEYTIETCNHVYGDFVIDADSNNTTMSRHCVYCGEKSETKQVPKARNDNKVEFELRLRRTNGMPFSPHENGTGFDKLQYKIYEDTRLLETINVDKDTLSHFISASANKLEVVGLPDGFTSVQREYNLDCNKPLVTIEVQAGIVKKYYQESEKHSPVPEQPLFIGDAMHDFWVQDVRDPGNSNVFSELMKGKKFVFMDFFHINCSWCTTYTKMFLNIYARDMYKYSQDILVILVDVQNDSEEGIKSYCNQHNIPDEFVVCKSKGYVDGRTNGQGILSWFETDKGYFVRTPGHVWLDSEGVIYNMKVSENEKSFRDLINGYFEQLYVGEAERKYEIKNGYTHSNPNPASDLATAVPATAAVIQDDKRKT